MLNNEDNALVTNIEPGSPMGEVFRRFWLPVMLASELPVADGVPVRFKILNEDLIAFRDTEGRVGIVDAYCPHRGAPLFYARNEESGLRCVYHGWKFDVNGVCVDLPSAPEGETYKEKIEIVRYPAVEAGDLIWPTWARRTGSRPSPHSNGSICLQQTATSPSSASSATTCRRWRATTTPATLDSSTA